MAKETLNLRLTIPEADINGLRTFFPSYALFNKALFQAVKRTSTAGATIAGRLIRDQYDVQAKYARRVFSTKVIDDPMPTGIIRVDSRPLPLIAFKTKFVPKRGVIVKMAKNQPSLHLRHVFKAKVASDAQLAMGVSHTGIYGRKPDPSTRSGFASRLPIKQHWGKRIADIVQLPVIEQQIIAGLGDRLHREIDSQLKRFGLPTFYS